MALPRRGLARPVSWLDARIGPYLYVAPFFIVFGVFGLYPLVYTAWVSLHDWDPLGDQIFIGFDNYRRLLADDPRFWNAAVNTVSIWLLSAVPQLLMGLGLAHLLNERLLRGASLFRMGLLVPNITSVLAVAIVFSSIFGRDYGLANWCLESIGLGRVNWQSNRVLSHMAVASMVAWRWTGYTALIYLSAMQAIPQQLYEAAALDGASRFRQLVHVTIPQLRTTIVFTAVISTIGGLQTFAEPLIFGGSGQGGTSGGTSRQFQTLTLFLYEQGIARTRYGYGSAVAWLLFLIIAVVAGVNYLLVRRIAAS